MFSNTKHDYTKAFTYPRSKSIGVMTRGVHDTALEDASIHEKRVYTYYSQAGG